MPTACTVRRLASRHAQANACRELCVPNTLAAGAEQRVGAGLDVGRSHFGASDLVGPSPVWGSSPLPVKCRVKPPAGWRVCGRQLEPQSQIYGPEYTNPAQYNGWA
jgi:hypothetical protein